MGIYSGYGSRGMGLDPMTEASAVLDNPEELLESFIAYELSKLDDSQLKSFVESEECQAMLEKKMITRKTLVRLSKNDDLARRKKMAAYQLAKEKNDPLWDKLVAVRVKERALIDKIVAKYGSKAERAAKVGQKEYLHKRLPAAAVVKPTRD